MLPRTLRGKALAHAALWQSKGNPARCTRQTGAPGAGAGGTEDAAGAALMARMALRCCGMRAALAAKGAGEILFQLRGGGEGGLRQEGEKGGQQHGHRHHLGGGAADAPQSRDPAPVHDAT